MKEIEFEQTRNENQQEVLKALPGWTYNWGLLSIFIVLIIVIPIISLIKIPVEVSGKAIILDKTSWPCLNRTQSVNETYAIVYLDQKYFTEIEIGRTIKINLTSFPNEQYGFIDAEVMCIANSVSKDSQLRIVCNISNSPKTKSGNEIELIDGMTGQGILNTNYVSIIDSFTKSLIQN